MSYRSWLNSDASKWIAALVVLILLGIALCPPPDRSSLSEGDDWRRTADGWERISTRLASTVQFGPNGTSAQTPAKAIRFDSHPAVLALLQLVVSLFGLSLPRYRSTNSRPALSGRSNWLHSLARSFRASAFGS